MTMDWLWYALDLAVPYLRTAVALWGKIPAGALLVAVLTTLWYVGRRRTFALVALPGAGAGGALGIWLNHAHGWHPGLCLAVGIAVAALIFLLLANFFFLRLAVAVIAWPVGVLVIWHLAADSLDTLWAAVLSGIGAIAIGSLLRQFVRSENRDLYVWLSDLIEDIRGD